jgi:hypothetical protein
MERKRNPGLLCYWLETRIALRFIRATFPTSRPLYIVIWNWPEWQGRGVATEAAAAVTEFWFETLGKTVLRVPKAIANEPSRRISEREKMRVVSIDERDYVSGRLPADLAHQLAHVMLADMTGGTRMLGDGGRSIRIRPWFDEGFAEVAAAVVCARPDIIEHYLAVPSQPDWCEDELDAALNDLVSPRRSSAFAEAVRRVWAALRSGQLGTLLQQGPSGPYNVC